MTYSHRRSVCYNRYFRHLCPDNCSHSCTYVFFVGTFLGMCYCMKTSYPRMLRRQLFKEIKKNIITNPCIAMFRTIFTVSILKLVHYQTDNVTRLCVLHDYLNVQVWPSAAYVVDNFVHCSFQIVP